MPDPEKPIILNEFSDAAQYATEEPPHDPDQPVPEGTVGAGGFSSTAPTELFRAEG
jgi:hypothetical protein